MEVSVAPMTRIRVALYIPTCVPTLRKRIDILYKLPGINTLDSHPDLVSPKSQSLITRDLPFWQQLHPFLKMH